MTSYETIYKHALRKISDPKLASYPDDILEDMLYGWMISAIAKHRTCEHDLADRDEDLKQFNSDLSDTEKEILAILITREWLAPQLNSTSLTLQVFSGKEEKYYSQKEHLLGLEARDEKLMIEAQKLSRDYTYTDSSYYD